MIQSHIAAACRLFALNQRCYGSLELMGQRSLTFDLRVNQGHMISTVHMLIRTINPSNKCFNNSLLNADLDYFIIFDGRWWESLNLSSRKTFLLQKKKKKASAIFPEKNLQMQGYSVNGITRVCTESDGISVYCK